MPQIRSTPLPGFTLALALALLFTLYSCAGPSTIRKNGLSYIQLNDSMPAARLSELHGHALSDSEMNEEGYAWRVCTLAYETGQVLLESDFQDQIRVNRIRVETPELKVKGGLKVGDSLADMLDRNSGWTARPYVRYQLMELTAVKYPGMVFLVKVDGYDYSQSGEEEVVAGELPGESKLVGIVVM